MKKQIFILSLLFCGIVSAYAGGSEYCNYTIGSVIDNNLANITWTTTDEGDVVITLSEADGGEPGTTNFRKTKMDGEGMSDDNLSKFKVGVNKENANLYFERVFTRGEQTYTLKLKDGISLPYGTPIYHEGFVEYETSKNPDCWPNPIFAYTYGGRCGQLAEPQNISISSTGRISFDEVLNATSYKVTILLNDALMCTQQVVSGDVLNFVPLVTATYTVVLEAQSIAYENSSTSYGWPVEAGHVYGKSKYCDWLWNTKNDNGSWPIYITWVTEPNGNMVITINPNGDEGEGKTAFREGVLSRIKVGDVDASVYFNESQSGNVATLSLKDPTNRPANGTIIHHDGAFCYKTGTYINAWPTLKADYVYGTKCSSADAVNPEITSFTLNEVTTTSATFTVVASDVDDEGTPQPLTYTMTGDNDFPSTVVTPDVNGQFTLSNLKKNRTYNFTITATDPSGNSTTSDPVAVRMIFDATDNLALNKPSEAGIHQDANIASQANDGDESNFWTSFGQGTKDQWWWKVDLGASFNINRVRILFNDHDGTYNLYSSEDGETWNNYAINFAIDNTNIDYTINVVTSTRYFKFTSTSANVGIKEFEVYGTGYNDGDEEAPVITAAALVGEAEENTATVSVTATDNVGVYACRFVDAANTYDQTFEYVAGENIIVTGLIPGTEYNFTITAIDRAENVSEGFEMDAFTTKANDNVPHTAAPTPIHAQMEVLSIYSDKFTSAVKTPFNWTSWGGETVYTQGNIGGNNYVHYVFGDHGEIGIGNKFVDASTDTEGLDVSLMQYLHVDIWSLTLDLINITLNDADVASNIQLTAGKWTSFDIPLADFVTAHQDIVKALQWMKFTGCQNKTIAVDNIYFYNETTEITIDEEQDNSLVISGFDGREMDVTLNRTFARDGFNYTLCLPFDMTAEQCLETFGEDYKLWEMGEAYKKSADMIYLPFSEVTSIEAGKPYIFCPAVVGANIENPIIAGVTINAAAPASVGNDVATMTGIYSPSVVDASNYVLGSDNWLYQSAGDEMKGLRCYFTFGSGVSQNVRARAVFHNSDVTTDLEPIHRFTDSPIKVIENGRFVIIRNNARYNAVGEPVNR